MKRTNAESNADDGSLIGTVLHLYAILRGNEPIDICDHVEDARSRADGYQAEDEGPVSIRFLDVAVVGEDIYYHPDDDPSAK